MSASSAQAHFVWLSLRGHGGTDLRMHFSEGRFDDTDEGLGEALARVELSTNNGPIEATPEGSGYQSSLEPGVDAVGGSLTYGLFGRGGPPALLFYNAKGARDLKAAGQPIGLELEVLAHRVDQELKLTVLHHGEPASGSEVVIMSSGRGSNTDYETNEQGVVVLPLPESPVFSVRAKVSADQAGEHDGKKYERVLRYSTLCVERLVETEAPAAADYEACVRLHETELLRARAPQNVFGMKGTATMAVEGERVPIMFVYLGGQLEVLEAPGLDDETKGWAAGMIDESLANLRSASLFYTPVAKASLVSIDSPRNGDACVRVETAGTTSTIRTHDHQVSEVKIERTSSSSVRSFLHYEATGNGHWLPSVESVVEFDASGSLAQTRNIRREYTQVEGTFVPASVEEVTVLATGSRRRTLNFGSVELIR